MVSNDGQFQYTFTLSYQILRNPIWY